ncbi:MAG TPA: hypothetical protein VME43_16570, partial [Bryobacteraceae bacterium]|nr:hypothetical protein [Bryobacteraceae bacterium]
MNVDLRQGVLREPDARAARLNISRQAVIKTRLGWALDQERVGKPRTKKAGKPRSRALCRHRKPRPHFG